ncbi:MAG: aminopeptidase [Clostridiaceae bacterium]|jgi:aspartyl aminopeptidase|nr:aminopeptidase [Clostridiaceae bacterium]
MVQDKENKKITVKNKEKGQTHPDIEKLKKKLEVSFPNLWDNSSDETIQTIMDYADDYKAYMDLGKTERHFINLTIETLENMGFVPLESQSHFEPGSKVYQTIRSKGLVAAVVGTDSPDTGFNLIGAHVDAPRLDLKPIPVYEDNELVYLKTHYYGGIKKYQWPAVPLAIHGTVIRQDGTPINISIGESPEDPVLTITDLLPHLGKDQMNKKATEVITGEDLNVLIASRPYPDAKVSGRFKLALLKLLNERYELTERDLVTAEIEIVPAGQARDVGLDKSMIGAYAQDDRVCAYTALTALTHVEKPKRTIACLLFDKEEIGSQGNTGAQSRAYEYALQELYVRTASTDRSQLDFARMLLRCQMLSADVSAGYDPTFASVYDAKNSSFMGHGLCLVKYVGARGKSGTSDANSEFFSRIVRVFDQESIPWQTGELGKVDMGGGGTVAAYLANLGMEVIDCGVPVLSMHAPFEITSKIDVYYTHLAYLTFFEKV